MKLITEDRFYKNVNKEAGFKSLKLTFDLLGDTKLPNIGGSIYFEIPEDNIFFAYYPVYKILILPKEVSEARIRGILTSNSLDLTDWQLVKITDEFDKDYTVNSTTYLEPFGEFYSTTISYFFNVKDIYKDEYNWKYNLRKDTSHITEGTWKLVNNRTNEEVEFVVRRYFSDVNYKLAIVFKDLLTWPINIKQANKKEKFIRNLISQLYHG